MDEIRDASPREICVPFASRLASIFARACACISPSTLIWQKLETTRSLHNGQCDKSTHISLFPEFRGFLWVIKPQHVRFSKQNHISCNKRNSRFYENRGRQSLHADVSCFLPTTAAGRKYERNGCCVTPKSFLFE